MPINPVRLAYNENTSGARNEQSAIGTTVAISLNDMRVREIITIYFAVSAPFAVAAYLARRATAGRLRALAAAFVASFCWPFAAIALFAARSDAPAHAKRISDAANFDEKVERGELDLANALRDVERLLTTAPFAEREEACAIARGARELAEEYVALALTLAQDEATPTPSARETELPRIAGRKGDDLARAGRCVRRHNATRIASHLAQVRRDFVHALAALHEIEIKDRHAASSSGNDGVYEEAMRRLSTPLIASDSRAIEMLSLFDDRHAVWSVARLLDAECARLRRLMNAPHLATNTSRHEFTPEGKPCVTQTAQAALSKNLSTTILSPEPLSTRT